MVLQRIYLSSEEAGAILADKDRYDQSDSPHGDPNVWHMPGICVYCDNFYAAYGVPEHFDTNEGSTGANFSEPEGLGWGGQTAAPIVTDDETLINQDKMRLEQQ